MQSEFAERAVPWVASLGLLLIWEIGCTVFNVPEFVLPKPTVVLAALVQWAGPIWFHASHTLLTTVLGLAPASSGVGADPHLPGDFGDVTLSGIHGPDGRVDAEASGAAHAVT